MFLASLNMNLISLGNLDKESCMCIREAGVMKAGKGPKLFMKESIDDDHLYKLVGSTLINLVCDATTSTKHVDDDTSLDDMNMIPISPNKSIDCMDLVVN
ncbi:unnamed protein product [Amaranthus hypochondriacus]